MDLPTLQGSRLLLRPYTLGDLRVFARLMADTDVMLHTGGPMSEDEAAQLFQRFLAAERGTDVDAWAIILKTTSQYVGHSFLKYSTDDGIPEVGFMLNQQFWGLGLATETVILVLGYAFDRAGYSSVFATVDADHTASIRVLEKAGLRLARWQQDVEGRYPVYSIDQKMWQRKRGWDQM
jgi:ribosomal-protein-alanine N-acetyltransferase